MKPAFLQNLNSWIFHSWKFFNFEQWNIFWRLFETLKLWLKLRSSLLTDRRGLESRLKRLIANSPYFKSREMSSIWGCRFPNYRVLLVYALKATRHFGIEGGWKIVWGFMRNYSWSMLTWSCTFVIRSSSTLLHISNWLTYFVHSCY